MSNATGKEGKKNIGYADESWNPGTGCIIPDCAVKKRLGKCWAEKMALRHRGREKYDLEDPFQPTYQGDRIINRNGYPTKLIDVPDRWRKSRRIAVCFMGDISSQPDYVIELILQTARRNPRHRFYLLTKNPKRLWKFKFPANVWVGVTINCQADLYRLVDLLKIDAAVHYVSFEPLYENLQVTGDFLIAFGKLDWFIIGAQTQPELQPKGDWVRYLVQLASMWGTPIFMKKNLKFEPRLTEFPEGL